jgi:hypothetical protein
MCFIWFSLIGDDNRNTIPKIGFDCLATPSAEVQAIGAGRLPSHIARVHNSHLYAAFPSGPGSQDCGSQGSDTNNVLFWVDLDCTKTAACVVSQTGKIAGDFNPAFAAANCTSWAATRKSLISGVPRGIRTPVTAVKGRCPRPG